MRQQDDQRSPYHHGDLRAALLRAALAELREAGPARLSLRQVARRAGVSHAAPAHHFKDKRGLFTAIASEGFALLHRRTSPELASDGALVGTGRRYVEFALEHPEHFSVMFDPSILDRADPALTKERDTAFAVLLEAIRRATHVTDETELGRQTLAAWVIAHGTATLWLSGNLPFDRDPELVAEVFAELAPAMVDIVQASVDRTGSS